MDNSQFQGVRFNGPAYYRITVQGVISKRFFQQFSNFESVINSSDFPGEVSSVVGKISDQSQLSGILNSLFSMHLALLEVNAMNNLDNI